MDIINTIADRLKQNFDFMISKGYIFQPLEVYNPANKERIFAKVNLKNDSLNRQLTFTIYPRSITEIEIYITDCSADLSMNFKHYTEFKKGNPPKHTQEYIVDTADTLTSVDEISKEVSILIDNDLKDVVFGREWITFPVYDPRDAY